MPDYYTKLVIDNVKKPIRDTEAVHLDEVTSVVLSVLDSPTIREALLNIYHPIGSYYFTDRNVNPSTFLGGEWETVEGRVLLGASTSYPVNSTGGSADSVVPEHAHTAATTIISNGKHTHPVSGTAAYAGDHYHGSGFYRVVNRFGAGNRDAAGIYSGYGDYRYTTTAGGHTHGVSGTAAADGEHTHNAVTTVQASGESGTGKNMMPYKAAYIWVRVA